MAAEGHEGGRCGPLCQHPGCWYSSERDRLKLLKCQGYFHYLAGLLLRRESKSFHKEPDDNGSGLPTLKVQTLEEDTLPPSHPTHQRRTQTLPPVRSYQRPCSKGSEPLSSQDLKKPFNFVQMTLEEEEEEEEAEEGAGGLQEITFSPVLIWKPGRKLMKKYHRRVGTPPQECGCGVGGGGGVGGGRDGGGGVGAGGRRSPIPLKTMDLTDALPPERSDKTVERKGTPKHRKGHRRPTTADAESFAYLGDIPPQVVAEILQQLRSESSSNIDGVLSQPVTTTSSTHQPSSRKPTTITNNANSNDATNVPSSIVYNLSSKKLQRTSKPVNHTTSQYSNAATNRKKVTSFSRELSKRPLEVLRGRYSTNLKEERLKPRIVEEGEGLLKGTKQRAVEDGEGLLLQKNKQNLCSYRDPPLSKPTKGTITTLLATQIEPSIPQNPPPSGYLGTRVPPSQSEVSPRTVAKHSSTRYPYGNPVVPRVPQKASLNGERGTHTVDQMGGEKRVELLSEAVLQVSPHVLPKVVTFQGGITRGRGGNDTHTQAKLIVKTEKAKESQSPRPRRVHIVQVPRHRLPSSAHSYSQWPFSEEASSVTPEAQVPPESPTTRQPALQQLQKNQEETPVEHCPISASVSPDYMLVGAHFSGDQLVLLNSEGQVIHQLADTESSANLGFHDANVVISGSTLTLSNHQPHPLAHKISKPPDGTRAPPPTGSIAARGQDIDGTRAPPPTGSIAARGQDTEGTRAPPPTASIAARGQDQETVKQSQPVQILAPLSKEQEQEDEIRSNDALVNVAQHGGTENSDDALQHAPSNDTIDTTTDPVDQITDKRTETACKPDAAQKSSEDLTPQTEPVNDISQGAEAVPESTLT